MIKKLSAIIVNWQTNKNFLTDEQKELYQYSYEVLISYIINILIIILLAAIMHSIVSVLVFSACYILLRTYCGGYHAKTNRGCTMVTVVLTLILCFTQKVVNKNLLSLSLICFVVSGILVFSLAPVADKNKPLDEIEIKRYRKRSRFIWGIETVLGLIFLHIKSSIGLTIALTHCIFSATLAYGKIKNDLTK